MRGKVEPGTLNPAPLIVTEWMVNGTVPVESTVTGNIAVDPTATLPKLKLAESTASMAVPGAVEFSELREVCSISAVSESIALGEAGKVFVAYPPAVFSEIAKIKQQIHIPRL